MTNDIYSCIVCGAVEWDLTKYDFPKCSKLKAKWLSILKIDSKQLRRRTRVCQRHFMRNQYVGFRLGGRLKSNALPTLNAKHYKDKGKLENFSKILPSSSATSQLSRQNTVNLVGHCAVCLASLSSSNSKPSNIKLTSLSHVWPLLLRTETGQSEEIDRFNFVVGKSPDGTNILSRVPLMCSLCRPNVEELSTLQEELDQLKRMLEEKTIRVKQVATKIRTIVDGSAKFRQPSVQKAISISCNDFPICVSNSFKFLNAVMGPSVAPVPISIRPNCITMVPNINAAMGESSNLIVITPATSLVGHGPHSLIPLKSTSNAVVKLEPSTSGTHIRFGNKILTPVPPEEITDTKSSVPEEKLKVNVDVPVVVVKEEKILEPTPLRSTVRILLKNEV